MANREEYDSFEFRSQRELKKEKKGIGGILKVGKLKKKHVSNAAGTGKLLNVTGSNYGTWCHDATLD